MLLKPSSCLQGKRAFPVIKYLCERKNRVLLASYSRIELVSRECSFLFHIHDNKIGPSFIFRVLFSFIIDLPSTLIIHFAVKLNIEIDRSLDFTQENWGNREKWETNCKHFELPSCLVYHADADAAWKIYQFLVSPGKRIDKCVFQLTSIIIWQ